MEKVISIFNEDCELVFNAPIDVVNLYGLINNAKKVGQQIDFRKGNIKDSDENIFSQLIDAVQNEKIEFLTLGDVTIRKDLDLKNFEVFVFGNPEPKTHSWLRKNYYESYVKVKERTKEAIAEAFDRVESALNFISAANFSTELSYYIKVNHFPICFADSIDSETVLENIEVLSNLINGLSPKNKEEYLKTFSLLRLAQTSSSPFEAYLLTWNAVDIACKLCNGLFSLNSDKTDDVDILGEFTKANPKNIDEARKLLSTLEVNSIEKRWERAIRHNFKDYPDHAEKILHKCFYRSPAKIRLYNVRNQIAHGSVNKDRRAIWQISYRLSEFNEFAPQFAMLAPLGKNILKRKSPEKKKDEKNLTNDTVRVFAYLLDKEGLPMKGVPVSARPLKE